MGFAPDPFRAADWTPRGVGPSVFSEGEDYGAVMLFNVRGL